MKTLSKLALLCAITLSVSACGTLGNVEHAAPYEMERTADHNSGVTYKVVEKETKVMECPAPKQCEACTDHMALEEQVKDLQAKLAACREKTMRVQESQREMLMK